MILSHKHKFIFLKTQKTAGTSIEIALSRICGKDDIITPISPEDELVRKNFGIFPQNYLKKYGVFPKKLNRMKINMRFWNHITGDEIRKKIDSKIWDSYYKFCFERNPWDKTVSAYFWNKKIKNLGDISFEEYLKTSVGKDFSHHDFPIYTHQNNVIVDFIGRYENLKEDLEKICSKIGINLEKHLPSAKSGHRKEKHHYSYYYSNKNRELIRNYFKKEIDLLDYTFEEKEKPNFL